MIQKQKFNLGVRLFAEQIGFELKYDITEMYNE